MPSYGWAFIPLPNKGKMMRSFMSKFEATQEVSDVYVAIYARIAALIKTLDAKLKSEFNTQVITDEKSVVSGYSSRGFMRLEAWNEDQVVADFDKAIAAINAVTILEGLLIQPYKREAAHMLVVTVDAWQELLVRAPSFNGFNVPTNKGSAKDILNDPEFFSTAQWSSNNHHPYWVAATTSQHNLEDIPNINRDDVQDRYIALLKPYAENIGIRILAFAVVRNTIVFAYTYASMPFSGFIRESDMCYALACKYKDLMWITQSGHNVPERLVDNAREVLSHAQHDRMTCRSMLEHLEASGCDLDIMPPIMKDKDHSGSPITKAGLAALVWHAMTYPVTTGKPTKPAAFNRYRRAYLRSITTTYKITLTN